MKLTIQRETTLGELDPGESILHEDKRWIVDEVRRSRTGYTVFCVVESESTSRRKSFEFKGDDTVVTAEPGPEDAVEIIETLGRIINGGIQIEENRAGFSELKFGGKGSLTLQIGTRFTVGGTPERVWDLVFEA